MRRLLIRPGAIGDCILCFPAMEYLRADYTEVWISSAVVPIVQFADTVSALSSTGLDLVAVGDLDIPGNLRERLAGFDSIVSWYGARREEFRQALLRIAPSCNFNVTPPPASYSGHAIDFFASQVGAPQGLAPHISLTASNVRDSVVIHPFSGSPRKNWPLEKYLALAERLPWQADWICGAEQALPGAKRFDSLADLAAWMRGARLYIGNDSGITHLAAAVECPTLAIFGPTDPAKWGARGTNVTLLQSNPLEDLSVEDVLDAANRLLD